MCLQTHYNQIDFQETEHIMTNQCFADQPKPNKSFIKSLSQTSPLFSGAGILRAPLIAVSISAGKTEINVSVVVRTDSVHFMFETVLTAVRLLWRVSLFSPNLRPQECVWFHDCITPQPLPQRQLHTNHHQPLLTTMTSSVSLIGTKQHHRQPITADYLDYLCNRL